MNPGTFEQANKTFVKPDSMTDEECSPLETWIGNDANNFPVIISKWTPTEEERAIIAAGGDVWLHIYGQGMPPVYVGAQNPFEG
jgi:hypothetical protein